MAARRTGRRPGDPAQTRQAILDAAAAAFTEGGFEKTSVRRVAGDAGGEPALVHHYFGTKDALFLPTLDVPADPDELVPQIVAGGRDEVGERLVRTFLSVWDSPRGAAAVAVLRSAVAHAWIARLLREFVFSRIIARVFTELGVEREDQELRAVLIASQMLGLALTRHVLRFEPMASASPEAVVAALAPTIQRYVDGDVAGDPVSRLD